MASRQESIRVVSRSKAVYINPQCEAVDASTECSGTCERVRLKITFPSERRYTVKVCSAHMLTFKMKARKWGHLE